VVGAAGLECREPAAEAGELIRRELDDGFGDFFDFHVTPYSTAAAWLSRGMGSVLCGKERGMCEGWSLARDRHRLSRRRRAPGQDRPAGHMLASVNAGYLGEYLDRASAMARAGP
jgi:hypothetical protein